MNSPVSDAALSPLPAPAASNAHAPRPASFGAGVLDDLRPNGIDLPFAHIAAEAIVPAVSKLIAEARARQASLAALTSAGGRGADAVTYASTFGALDAMTEPLDLALGVVGHLESVASTPELRDAFNAVQAEVTEFYGRIVLDPALYRTLVAFAESDAGRALTGAHRRHVDKTLADFRRNGAALDDAGKARLTEIDVALAQTTLKFSQNVVDATGAFEIVLADATRLAGLPDAAIAAAKQSAEAKGLAGYRLTLQAPSYLAVMTYADDATLREAMYRAHTTRATKPPHDNRPLVREVLVLRREKANLLGYRDFADLILADRMAGSGARARAFVADLHEKARLHADRENADLLAFAREFKADSTLTLRAWDIAYFAEKQRRARFNFDEQAIKPYLSLDAVMHGLFAIAERLYGLAITPWLEAQKWDPSVTAYRIADHEGVALGGFYVDVFPRETKRDGAWMHGLVTATDTRSVDADGRRKPALQALVANVTPPLGDAPALLSHGEVETMFHEFGHLLHHTLSGVAVRALGGTQVAWDFVELPSMIMENWCWERDALDLFARHHETRETIPNALFSSMKRARNFRAANGMMRQLGFAEVDLALHCDVDPAAMTDEEIMELARVIAERHASTALPADYAMIAAFSHLFGGAVVYAAGYYSYKWAEVLEADAFSRFRDAGIFDRAVGEAFRAQILSRGDSEDAGVLFRNFMGRDARVEALLERAGLVGASA